MNGINYLQDILNKYRAQNLYLYSNEIEKLHKILKEWANNCFIEILESGSRAKQTAINLSSDVDYMISLTSNCNKNKGGLASIYNSLFNKLKSYYYNVRKQNVSFRVDLNGLEVDITPARKYSGNTNYHSLYISQKDTWIQTNIQQHINDVKNSGRTKEIKLLKIWRELHNLEFTSIYLEYLVLEVLKYRLTDNLEDNFHYILQELAKNEGNTLYKRIVDPSNSKNILSDLLSDYEKNKIINTAKQSISQLYWNNIIW
jgi:hypothetical protein